MRGEDTFLGLFLSFFPGVICKLSQLAHRPQAHFNSGFASRAFFENFVDCSVRLFMNADYTEHHFCLTGRISLNSQLVVL